MQGDNLQTGECTTSESYSSFHLASPLQPFLCYVPGDLQQELAHLRTHVFPHLDSLCQPKGTCFRPVDIQRAYNDDDDNQKDGDLHLQQSVLRSHFQQRLKISLDFINSSSTFLCLLGHQYGGFSSEDGKSSTPGLPEKDASFLSEVEGNLCGAVRGGYPWVMEEKHQTCSLIELEVTEAAFMGNPTRCFFYFKDCTPQVVDDDYGYVDGENKSQLALFRRVLSSQKVDDRQRLWQLKSKIINHLHPVRFFRDLLELEDLVTRDWKSIINEFTEQHSISAYQDSVEGWCHESYIQALCRVFVTSAQTTEAMELLDTFVLPEAHKSKAKPYSNVPVPHFSCNAETNREQEKSILLLGGERGCGKSSLVAWWLQDFHKQNPRFPTIPYFCGTSTTSKDVRFILRHFTAELRKMFYGDLPEWAESLEDGVEPRSLNQELQAFSAAIHLGPCVLLLDGLDCLTETLDLSLQEVKELRWLPATFPPHCRLIVTTNTTDLTYKSLISRSDIQVVILPGLSDPWVQCSIIRRHIALPYKALSTTFLQRIVRRKICRLPVVLAILGSELRTCGMQREEEEERELVKEYVEVDSISELWVKVIHRWILDYSRPSEEPSPTSKGSGPCTIPPKPDLRGWVWDTLCLIHTSRSGLTETEMLALLEKLGYCGPLRVHALEWAQLRSAFSPWVWEKPNCLLCFRHQSLSQAMELLLLGVSDLDRSRSFYHGVLAGFFQRPSGDPRSGVRKLQELPWHLAQTNFYRDLHNLLTNQADMGLLVNTVRMHSHLKVDVVCYWTLLSKKGYDPASSLQRLIGHKEVSNVSGCGLATAVKFTLLSSDILLCLGKSKESENILLQTEAKIQQADDLGGDSGSSLLEVQHKLAKLYIHLHQHEEAELYCRKGLQTARALIDSLQNSSEDIKLSQLLCSLCQLELERDRLSSVAGILREISITNFTSIHPCAEATITLLQGLHKLCLGEVTAAEACLQAVLSSRRRWYGSEHQLVAAVEEKLADIWANSIHTDKDLVQRKAAELYRHVIHVRQTAISCKDMTFFLCQSSLQDLPVTLLKLGKVLLQSSCSSDRREALTLLQRAEDLSHLRNVGYPPTERAEHFDLIRKPVITRTAPETRPASTGGLYTKYCPLKHLPPAPGRAKDTFDHSGSGSSVRKVTLEKKNQQE